MDPNSPEFVMSPDEPAGAELQPGSVESTRPAEGPDPGYVAEADARRAECVTEAREAYAAGNVELATRHLYSALAFGLSEAGVLGDLAAMVAELGSEEEAERLFARALANADPSDLGLRMNYAAFLGQQGRLNEAVGELDRLAQELGDVLALASTVSEDAVDEIYEQKGIVEVNLARAWLEMGETERAKAIVEEWLLSGRHWEMAQDILDAAISAEGGSHLDSAERYMDERRASVGMVAYLAVHRLQEDGSEQSALEVLEAGVEYLPIEWFLEVDGLFEFVDDMARRARRRRMAAGPGGDPLGLEHRVEAIRRQLRCAAESG